MSSFPQWAISARKRHTYHEKSYYRTSLPTAVGAIPTDAGMHARDRFSQFPADGNKFLGVQTLRSWNDTYCTPQRKWTTENETMQSSQRTRRILRRQRGECICVVDYVCPMSDVLCVCLCRAASFVGLFLFSLHAIFHISFVTLVSNTLTELTSE